MTTVLPKKAVLIGINYIGTPNQLNGCIDDVSNMRNYLIDVRGYTDNNIIMLRDDVNDVTKKPTRANILAYLTALIANSANCSEIWFLYSGHGSQIKEIIKGGELDGMDEVIVPLDFMTKGFIPDNDIYNIIKNSKCPSIFLFDSCHSGTICDLQWATQYEPTTNVFTTTTTTNSIQLANPNIFTFSGCKDSQTSADTYNNISQMYVGAFTNAFLETLRLDNHNVAIMQLYKDVCNNLKQTGYSQVPTLTSSSKTPTFVFNRSLNIGTTKNITTNTSSTVVTKQIINNNMRSLFTNKNI